MKTIYIDCGMGCAGDMLTAALLELHPDKDEFLSRMNSALNSKAVISARDDFKCGIKGTHVTVSINGDVEGKPMRHHHTHTSISEVLSIIDATPLPEPVQNSAKAVYTLLAEAEAAVHGGSVENIHFHEVGSLDALADILSVCQLMHELSPERVLASPVNVGGGTVRCAHGVLPVPAPAAEYLLRGIPCFSGQIKHELCTPTGAALLKYFVSEFCDMPVMTVANTGHGTGSRDFETANILRVMLGETDGTDDSVAELVCNIDDMSAEDLGFALEQLFAAGALDAYFTNIGMKKCRPGVMLTCLCRENVKQDIIKCIFKHTTTLGIREHTCRRYTLSRQIIRADTPHGSVRIKVSEGYGVRREKPEHDDLARLSRETGLSISQLRKSLE